MAHTTGKAESHFSELGHRSTWSHSTHSLRAAFLRGTALAGVRGTLHVPSAPVTKQFPLGSPGMVREKTEATYDLLFLESSMSRLTG